MLRARRKTTLPDPPRPRSTAAFSEAMRLEFADAADDERRLYNRQVYAPMSAAAAFAGDTPLPVGRGGRRFIIPIRVADGWDAAVQWIEDREAARAEWPWPRRPS